MESAQRGAVELQNRRAAKKQSGQFSERANQAMQRNGGGWRVDISSLVSRHPLMAVVRLQEHIVRRRTSACLVILTLASILCGSSFVVAQDDAELKTLRDENAQLKADLEAAKERIEKLEKQIETLRAKDAKDDQKQAQDLFIVGSVWSGSRFYNQNGKTPNRTAQPWTMKVTERDGKKFKAAITFTAFDGLEKEITVAGTAPVSAKGGVSFKTDQKGIFQQAFKGVLAGQQVSLECDGTGVEGTRVFGTGDLKRE